MHADNENVFPHNNYVVEERKIETDVTSLFTRDYDDDSMRGNLIGALYRDGAESRL